MTTTTYMSQENFIEISPQKLGLKLCIHTWDPFQEVWMKKRGGHYWKDPDRCLGLVKTRGERVPFSNSVSLLFLFLLSILPPTALSCTSTRSLWVRRRWKKKNHKLHSWEKRVRGTGNPSAEVEETLNWGDSSWMDNSK